MPKKLLVFYSHKIFTPTFWYFYTDICVISVTLCNSGIILNQSRQATTNKQTNKQTNEWMQTFATNRGHSYLIFVSNASNIVNVKFSNECKKIPKELVTFCCSLRVNVRILSVKFSDLKICQCKKWQISGLWSIWPGFWNWLYDLFCSCS